MRLQELQRGQSAAAIVHADTFFRKPRPLEGIQDAPFGDDLVGQAAQALFIIGLRANIGLRDDEFAERYKVEIAGHFIPPVLPVMGSQRRQPFLSTRPHHDRPSLTKSRSGSPRQAQPRRDWARTRGHDPPRVAICSKSHPCEPAHR